MRALRRCRPIGASMLPPPSSRRCTPPGTRARSRAPRAPRPAWCAPRACARRPATRWCPCRGDGRCRRAAALEVASCASSAFCSVWSDCPRRDARRARRLVDDEDGGVLVDDVERQLLSRDAALGRQARFDGRDSPPTTRSRAPTHEAVDEHRPLLDPALDARTRVLRQELGKRLVQPPSGEIRGQIEAMSLELGGQPCGPRLGGAAILHASGDHFKLKTPANPRNGKNLPCDQCVPPVPWHFYLSLLVWA